MIREIANKAFSNIVWAAFDDKAIGELIRDSHGADSLLFLIIRDSVTRVVVIESIKLDRLFDQIRPGSESIELDKKGKGYLKTCDTIL